MHDCHDCGEPCDCDGDDVWNDAFPSADCLCGCEPSDDRDDEDGKDDDLWIDDDGEDE